MFSITIHREALFVIYDRDVNRPLGTAFCFLTPEWIVTAKHVVVDAGLQRERLSLLSFNGEPLTATVVFEHPDHDLAVLRIEGQSRCEVPLFPSYEGYAGKKGLMYCGWAPSLTAQDERPYKLVVSHVPQYTREKRLRDSGCEFVLEFDATTMKPGHSGGPVLGEGGGVVAVLINLINPGDSGVPVGRATSILELLRFLSFASS